MTEGKRMKATLFKRQERQDRDHRRMERMDSPWAESRIFIDYNETVMEHLENRRSRPYTALKPVLAQLLVQNGIRFEKLRYSRYAGCSMCPCSGGFFIDGGKPGVDYFVKVAL